MTIDDDMAALRSAATSGDPDAARDLGRLLCLVPADPADPADSDRGDDTENCHPGESWLRRTLAARPDDTSAAILLATRLALQLSQQVAVGEEEPELRDEAVTLYRRVLGREPDHHGARIGLAELRELYEETDDPADDADCPESPQPYGFYLIETDTGSGSVNYHESLVVTDPDELRWACDRWLDVNYPEPEYRPFPLALEVWSGTVRLSTVDLVHSEGTIDWAAVTVPPLPGPPLPVGCPMRTSDGLVRHYGYSLLVS